jgi:hypothetical protein
MNEPALIVSHLRNRLMIDGAHRVSHDQVTKMREPWRFFKALAAKSLYVWQSRQYARPGAVHPLLILLVLLRISSCPTLSIFTN